jgi:uncharacterized delta-60 repeat protein
MNQGKFRLPASTRGRCVALATAVGLSGALAATALGAGLAGDPDPSFGTAGRLDVAGLDNPNLVSVTLDSAGRPVVADRERVIRLTPTGQPDQTLGANGVVPFADRFANASSVAVDGQGRILVAGSDQPGGGIDRTALLRLLPDGTPDESFGANGNGILSLENSPASETGTVVRVDAQGKYVIAGTVGFDTNQRTEIVRLYETGTPDSTFSTDGVVVLPGSTKTEVAGLAFDGSDVLVSGFEPSASSATPAPGFVARVSSSGNPVTSFGTSGIARTTPRVQLQTNDLIVLPDHRIRLIGTLGAEGASTARGVLSGFTATGQPDAAVGAGGQRIYDLAPGTGTALQTATLSGSKLLVGGATGLALNGDSLEARTVLGRWSVDGEPDPTFSGDGFAINDNATSPALPYSIAVTADGKILTGQVLFAQQIPTTKFSTRIARYLSQDEASTPIGTTPSPEPPTTRVPPVPPTTPPPPALALTSKLSKTQKLGSLASGKKLTITLTPNATCTGTVAITLTKTEAKKRGFGKKAVTLGTSKKTTFPSTAAKGTAVSVAVDKKYRARLKKLSKLSASLAISCKDASGRTATRTAALSLKK